jgi:hypothetical protein
MSDDAKEKSKKISLLERHQMLLGQIPSKDVFRDELDVEQRALDQLELPELVLPGQNNVKAVDFSRPKQKRFIYGFSAAALLAASLLLGVFNGPLFRSTQDELTPKGSFEISVYVEQGSQIRKLIRDEPVPAGVGVRFSILPNLSGTVVPIIVSADGQPLSTVEMVKSGIVDVVAGREQDLSGALKLTAKNDGERLMVIVCSPSRTAQILELVQKFEGKIGLTSALESFANAQMCQIHIKTLRTK